MRHPISHEVGKKYHFEVRRAKRAFNNNADCDFCGEQVKDMRSDTYTFGIPSIVDGLVKCPICVQSDWEDFCGVVGANPNTGIGYDHIYN